MCAAMKDKLGRQMFEVAIQAAASGKVVARETLKVCLALTFACCALWMLTLPLSWRANQTMGFWVRLMCSSNVDAPLRWRVKTKKMGLKGLGLLVAARVRSITHKLLSGGEQDCTHPEHGALHSFRQRMSARAGLRGLVSCWAEPQLSHLHAAREMNTPAPCCTSPVAPEWTLAGRCGRHSART